MSWAPRKPLRRRPSGRSGGRGCGHSKQASTPLNIYHIYRIITIKMIQRGRGALDFGQGHIHPPRADRPHHLRLATSFVIELVVGRFIYEQKGSSYDSPMLIMTYGAILSLAILRDPFIQLDRKELLRFLQTCQKDDGGSVLRIPTDSRLDKLLSSPQVCPVPWERRKGPTHDLLCVFNLCDARRVECDQYRTCYRIYPAMSSKSTEIYTNTTASDICRRRMKEAMVKHRSTRHKVRSPTPPSTFHP